MNCCRETTKMGVPPGNRRVLVSRRTSTVRRRDRHPRTSGRTAISVVAASDSCNIRANGTLKDLGAARMMSLQQQLAEKFMDIAAIVPLRFTWRLAESSWAALVSTRYQTSINSLEQSQACMGRRTDGRGEKKHSPQKLHPSCKGCSRTAIYSIRLHQKSG